MNNKRGNENDSIKVSRYVPYMPCLYNPSHTKTRKERQVLNKASNSIV